MEEKEKLKTTVTSLKDALRRTVDDLTDSQAQSSSAVMELELERQTNETLTMKCDMLEKEVGELKSKLLLEVDRRRAVDNERNELEKSKSLLGDELVSLKQICQQYEDAVSALNTEISNKENELFALQETLGEDSPLLDIAELKGKLVGAEESISALKHRLDSTTLENASLSRKFVALIMLTMICITMCAYMLFVPNVFYNSRKFEGSQRIVVFRAEGEGRNHESSRRAGGLVQREGRRPPEGSGAIRGREEASREGEG